MKYLLNDRKADITVRFKYKEIKLNNQRMAVYAIYCPLRKLEESEDMVGRGLADKSNVSYSVFFSSWQRRFQICLNSDV